MLELEERNAEDNEKVKEILHSDELDTKPLYKIKQEEFLKHEEQ